MNEVERAERLLKRYLGLVPPWDRPLVRRTFEYVLEHLWEIESYIALGLKRVTDPARYAMIVKHIGPQGSNDPEEYGFNVWLADKCMGDPPPPRHILLRCAGCQRIRVHRNFQDRACKCGGLRMQSAIPDETNTRVVMKALVAGR